MPYVARFCSSPLLQVLIDVWRPFQQGTFSEKDEQLRQILAKLDAIDTDDAVSTLTHEDIVSLRRRMGETQTLVRETVDRLRQVQEENEMHQRRRDELESRISGLEAEYEELLGSYSGFLKYSQLLIADVSAFTEKTINDEEVSNVDVAESMAELKVGLIGELVFLMSV